MKEFNFMEDSVNTSLSLVEIIFGTCQEKYSSVLQAQIW